MPGIPAGHMDKAPVPAERIGEIDAARNYIAGSRGADRKRGNRLGGKPGEQREAAGRPTKPVFRCAYTGGPAGHAAGKKARRAGRPKKEPQAEEIAVTIDCGKVGALRKAGWSAKEIAAEFGIDEETMKEVLKILERK